MMPNTIHSVTKSLAFALLLGLSACGEEAESSEEGASATLSPLGMSGVTGSVTLAASAGGVTLTGTVTGLAAGTQHGFHIHEVGDCNDAMDAMGMLVVGGAAGGHWNPAMHDHGSPEAQSHLGDLGNIVADAAGTATLNITKAGATLGDGSMTDVMGHALIVHANPDDLTTQPVGNAGGRIACGVVQ